MFLSSLFSNPEMSPMQLLRFKLESAHPNVNAPQGLPQCRHLRVHHCWECARRLCGVTQVSVTRLVRSAVTPRPQARFSSGDSSLNRHQLQSMSCDEILAHFAVTFIDGERVTQ